MSGEITRPVNGDIFRTSPTVTVYTRPRWSAAWYLQSRMHCNRVRFGCSPEGSSAEFVVDLGAERTIDTPSILHHMERLEVLNYYVRVEILHSKFIVDDPVELATYLAEHPGATVTTDGFHTYVQDAAEFWYGIIVDDGGPRDGARYYAAAPEGGVTPVAVRVLSGTQLLQAVGLEYIFDHVYIDKAYFEAPSAVVGSATLGQPITFNEPDNFADKGNRAAALSADNVYLFTEDLADAEYWSTKEIVKYLIEMFQPVDWDAVEHLPLSLTVNALATLPTWDRPIVRCEGRTLRDVLNQLCDRRRQLLWSITVDEDVGEGENAAIKIDVANFVPETITLPSGETQEANANLRQIDFDEALDVSATLTESVRHKCEQVVVRGDKKRSCFSLAYDDGTLVSDWKAADETAYEDGPAELVGTTAEQTRQIIEYRRADRFRQVYSYFKVPDDWDYEVGNAEGSAASVGADELRINPDLQEDIEWIYRPKLRFSRKLFRELSTTAATDSAQDAPVPFGVIVVEDGSFRFIDKLAETDGMIDRGAGKGRCWSASLRMRDDCPGVIVKVSGAQQLAIAESEFGGAAGTKELPRLLDWKDMIVTVAAELHANVEVKYPETADLAGTEVDAIKRVYVDVGDAGRLDYVVPSTVTDLDDGQLVRDADGGYVRDDREWMEDLARYVYGWYGITRQAFQFSMKQILGLLKVGELITKIGSDDLEETVNSVVVGVTYDFNQQTTTVDTAFSNLDPTSILDWFAEQHTEKLS
jgi:hypothetical protein